MATTKNEEVKKEQTYKIRLPKTKDMQDDVTVCINGHWTIIKRGVEVEVSAAVKEVLDNKERMEQLAMERSAELANEK